MSSRIVFLKIGTVARRVVVEFEMKEEGWMFVVDPSSFG